MRPPSGAWSATYKQRLEYLEQETRFYVGKGCKRIIEDMKQRDLQRKQAQEA